MDAVQKEIADVESTKDIYSDIYNAKIFTQLFKNKIRWCKDYGGWFIYNGKFWERDCNDGIIRYAIKTHAHMCGDIEKIKDRKYFTHLKNSAASHALAAMLNCTKAYLGASTNDFDNDGSLFNCSNGIISLKDGIKFPHAPEHLITKISPVVFDNTVECPQWIKFLNDIFIGRQDIIDFMQRVVGYSLSSSIEEQCLFILYGRGRNGKSKFLETIFSLLGDYAMNCPASTFIRKQQNTIPNDIARLKGARMVTAIENNQNVSFDESMIKQITGGDRISARFLNKEYFDFIPSFKIFFATNHKPNIRGTDVGIWRRIRMIPFDLKITDEMEDKALGIKLHGELSGILNWAIDGHKKWMKEGLSLADSIKMATDCYRDEEDQIGTFIKDNCTADAEAWIAVTEFKNRLIDAIGWKISQKQVSAYMEANGFKDNDNRKNVNGHTVRVYKGLRFVSAGEKQTDMGWEE